MKRIFSFICILAVLFSLAGCGAKKAKKDVFSLVNKNYDRILEACINEDADALLDIKGVSEVKIVPGYVLVYCRGSGIAPSSQDYGFYYTEDNIPAAIDCNLDILTTSLAPKDSGFECTFDHNTFYTEPIKGNIYFYSNAY